MFLFIFLFFLFCFVFVCFPIFLISCVRRPASRSAGLLSIRPSIRLPYVARTLTLDITCKHFNQSCFLPDTLIGIISLSHLAPLSVTLIVVGGHKVNAKQKPDVCVCDRRQEARFWQNDRVWYLIS